VSGKAQGLRPDGTAMGRYRAFPKRRFPADVRLSRSGHLPAGRAALGRSCSRLVPFPAGGPPAANASHNDLTFRNPGTSPSHTLYAATGVAITVNAHPFTSAEV
jgi:hypothetical protein